MRALEIARRFNFRYRARSYARMAVDGSAEQLFTRYERLPARGDPPVSPEHQLS